MIDWLLCRQGGSASAHVDVHGLRCKEISIQFCAGAQHLLRSSTYISLSVGCLGLGRGGEAPREVSKNNGNEVESISDAQGRHSCTLII